MPLSKLRGIVWRLEQLGQHVVAAELAAATAAVEQDQEANQHLLSLLQERAVTIEGLPALAMLAQLRDLVAQAARREKRRAQRPGGVAAEPRRSRAKRAARARPPAMAEVDAG